MLLLPTPLRAQGRWQKIADFEGRSTWFDYNTIERLPGDGYRVWVRDDYTPSQVLHTGARAKSGTARMELDCSGRRIRILEATYYDAEGNVVLRDDRSGTASWNAAVPESAGEADLDAVCRFMADAARRYSPDNPFQPGGARRGARDSAVAAGDTARH